MRSLEEDARFLRAALTDIVMREDFGAFKAVMLHNRMARMVSGAVDDLVGSPEPPTDRALLRRMTTLKRLLVDRATAN